MTDLRKWHDPEHGPTGWLDLQIAAMEFVLELTEIKYLDDGKKYASLEPARQHLREMIYEMLAFRTNYLKKDK
jgi:hypothetical protein